MIRQVEISDADRIAEIYNYYILNTAISFEEDTVSAGEMKKRIGHANTENLPWLVAEDDDVVGYAYASRWKGRRAYRFAAEVTVYISQDQLARGWGKKLYRRLFSDLRRQSVHVLIAGIALPNSASVALHESFAMEKVAHFNEVGFKFGRWVDVGYWQCKLDE